MHHRRSIRLKDYDYTQNGAYFVTICTHNKLPLFGHISDQIMHINTWGKVVQICWDEIPTHYPQVELDAFVVMPNHIHGIIVVTGTTGDTRKGMIYHAPTQTRQFSKPIANSLSSILGTFKAAATRQINRLTNPPDHPIWQRNYHEHIIRNEKSLNDIQAYVIHNAAKWSEDSLFINEA